MRAGILLATLLTTSASAIAGALSITSPNHPQTFAYGEMIWHQLYLECTAGEVAARITFSNLPYVDSDEPRRDEPFDFRFPGVRFDPGRRPFFARGHHGELIQVARFHSEPSFGWIDLASGVKIYLLKESGRVTALLIATDYPARGNALDRDGRQFFATESFGFAVPRTPRTAGQQRPLMWLGLIFLPDS